MITIQRGSGQKLPFIDVRDYGVVGDGVTDDAAAINSVFLSAPDNSSICFPPGQIYIFGSALKLPPADNVTITGYGATLKMKDTANSDLMVSANYPAPGGGDFVKLVGFTIDGNKTNNVGSGSTAFYGVNYGLIKDVYIHDCDGVGFFLIAANHWIVSDCRSSYAEASGFCAYNGCSNITFRDCIAIECAPGFLLEGPEVDGQSVSTNLNIIGGAAIDTRTGQDGIQVFTGVHGFKIIGVTSSGADGKGINVHSFRTVALTTATVNKNGIISNCILKNNDSDEGIKIWDDGNFGNYCTDIIVDGNVCFDDAASTQGYGITIQGQSDNLIITNNDLRNNVTQPLVNGGSGTNIQIYKNLGYINEKSGKATGVSTGGTIAHGLSTTPTNISVTAASAGATDINCSVDPTNITVNFGGGGSKDFFWSAYAQ